MEDLVKKHDAISDQIKGLVEQRTDIKREIEAKILEQWEGKEINHPRYGKLKPFRAYWYAGTFGYLYCYKFKKDGSCGKRHIQLSINNIKPEWIIAP